MEADSLSERTVFYILQGVQLSKACILHLFEKYKHDYPFDQVKIVFEVYLVDPDEVDRFLINRKTEDISENMTNKMKMLQKTFTNIFNLVEPEHSNLYTMQKFEVLMP